jgi:glycosyltransferase involved in cell wall biosynthesis
MKKISVIVPCFNEEEVLNASMQRLVAMTQNLPSYAFEIILVNDGSKDKTALLIKEECAKSYGINLDIKGINLSRNFGHQLAITAGLDHCVGDAAVVIDADLQDPPEIIPQMIAKWEEGFDVIYGKRNEREGESWFKLQTAKWFYRLINKLSDTEIPLDTGDFRLMDRQALNEFLEMRELYRFVRGMVSWIGFNQTYIVYDRDPRFAGQTKYPLKRMIRLATDAILSFSTVPLRIATISGFIVSIGALSGILLILANRLFTNNWVEGWTFLMVTLLLLGGMILSVLGIIGSYLGRIYGEAKKRPLYIIKDKFGY